jgi:hypothetical protein
MTYFLNFRTQGVGGAVIDPYLLEGDGTTVPRPFEARAVLSDMNALITHDAPPHQRFGLRPTMTDQGERFWLIGR